MVTELERIDDRLLLLGAKSDVKFPQVDPGQFFHLAIDSYKAGSHWPESRAFSIAHSTEDGEYRFILSRSGAFVERLWREATIGNTLWLKGPYGELSIELEDIPCGSHLVFVAAGSGVSPFPSLIRKRIESSPGDTAPVFLLYSARSEALLTERRFFRDLSIRYPKKFNVEFFITGDSSQSTDTEALHRRIQNEDVLLRVRDLPSAHLFLSGPNPLVFALKNYAISIGMPLQNIHFDEWG